MHARELFLDIVLFVNLFFMLRITWLLGSMAVWGWAQTPEAARIAELEQRVAKLEAALEAALKRLPPAPPPAPQGESAILADLPPATRTPAPPPTAAAAATTTKVPQELLPSLGKIGATTSFVAGGHSGPFRLGAGTYFGGAIDLPLRLVPGGRLHYEISAGLMRSSTRFNVTSNVAQVANLAALATLNPQGGASNITAAVTGTGAAPFPVTVEAQNNMQLLQVVPFAFKYVHTKLDRVRFRPYAVAGFGTYVTITNQTAFPGVRADANLPPELRQAFDTLFGGRAPLGGALIGGQITAARELVERGVPAGQGDINIGFQTGGGFEWRLSKGFSIGLDFRWNRLQNGANYSTFAPRAGWHF